MEPLVVFGLLKNENLHDLHQEKTHWPKGLNFKIPHKNQPEPSIGPMTASFTKCWIDVTTFLKTPPGWNPLWNGRLKGICWT